ncbi:AIPR family protein [Vibrio sp. H11]|uniref:AIPR family protein n=1 Tax=Vibrio sp. H11 TaxID=2565928 RepID=UPI0010A66E01|nr:AIPR family protein [Vibrio sp. H11]
MKDLVLNGFVKSFAESAGIPSGNSSDAFEAFSSSVILKKYHACEISNIEEFKTGGGIDGGIDGIAILVNGRPVRSEEDLDFFHSRLRRLNFEFVFIQAKTSAAFDAGGIGTFLYGVSQFFADEPEIRFNDDIEIIRSLKNKVYDLSIHMDENPRCYAYYSTAGVWNNDPEPSARLSYGVGDLEKSNLFSHVSAQPIDAKILKEIYRELERGVTREVRLDKTATFPSIGGVDEAYLGLLSGHEYINLISTDDGSLNRTLFYDNVRDFQGNNPVNRDIATTLGGGNISRFPLLNNGVTIVARNIVRTGDNFRISDFQIVNGCQTTHVLFEHKESITSETFIPIKLVATNDSEIITEVIKATNWQTAVMPEALESLSPFHKDIEDFYNSHESSRPREDRVYYERRSKQYYFDPIPANNIVSLTTQTKAFVAMFLNEPHSHPRYYGELLKAYESKLFVADHKPAPYFASGLAFVLVHRMMNQNIIPRDMRKYTYHILMLLRIHLVGDSFPKMNSHKISSYCEDLIEKIRDEKQLTKACEKIVNDLRDSLKISGASVDGNTPDRLKSFTEVLLKRPNNSAGNHVEKEPELIVGNVEKGKLRWFDDVKGYGFIDRDVGGDIFVHATGLLEVPWSKRIKGTPVEYSVLDGRKGMQASEVRLQVE